MSFVHTLEKLGFSAKKSLVYLTLLQHGEMPASEIAKLTKIVRTTVYDILKELIKDGFVGISNDRLNKKNFFADSPDKLIDYVGQQASRFAEEKKILDERQAQLTELIPQLRSLSDEAIGKPKIHFFDGAKGLVEALNYCLTSKQQIAIYGGLEAWNRWMPDHLEWFIGEAKKRKIDVRRIGQKTIGKLRGEEEELASEWETRLLPVGFALPGFTVIYGERILQASFQRPMATVIHDKELAGSQKTIFELFWQFLRESD